MLSLLFVVVDVCGEARFFLSEPSGISRAAVAGGL